MVAWPGGVGGGEKRDSGGAFVWHSPPPSKRDGMDSRRAWLTLLIH